VSVSRRGEPSVEVLGLEARAKDGDHQSIRLWLRLLSATNLVKGEVQSRLRRTFGTTLARFDLLAQLERHPEGLAMGPLSRRMMVTAGNVTRLVDQLEAEGLVARVPDPGDRRAVRVRLTPEGRRKFSAMATVHEGWIVELFRGLSREQREQLYTLLGALKQSVARALSREGGGAG
jgi:DNA-binding MarR family transcriptional regulator